MADILDYIDWRGDLSMEQDGLNDVDSLILCRLAYLPFERIVPGDFSTPPMTVQQAVKEYFVMHGHATSHSQEKRKLQDEALLTALGENPRYADMTLMGYVKQTSAKEEKQFAALTIDTGDGMHYLAFRGTDNTLIGWKEDLNMSFLATVPAQTEAVAYLERAAQALPGMLRLGGHSKGGNLAAYAAAFCKEKTQERIASVSNHDGPGFDASLLEQPGYQRIKQRIRTFVPQTSVIGMLLGHEEEYTVIHSTQNGLMQHDLYSWEVGRNGFITLEHVDNSSRFIDRTIKDWVAKLPAEKREKFFDALFEILSRTDAKTVQELTASWFKNARVISQSLKDVDEPTKELILEVLKSLLRAAKENIWDFLPGQRNLIK